MLSNRLRRHSLRIERLEDRRLLAVSVGDRFVQGDFNLSADEIIIDGRLEVTGDVRLEAWDGDIFFSSGGSIVAPGEGSVTLQPEYDIVGATVDGGSGDVLLNTPALGSVSIRDVRTIGQVTVDAYAGITGVTHAGQVNIAAARATFRTVYRSVSGLTTDVQFISGEVGILEPGDIMIRNIGDLVLGNVSSRGVVSIAAANLEVAGQVEGNHIS